MPLAAAVTAMEKALISHFNTPTSDLSAIASRLAGIYTKYAYNATSCMGGTIVPGSLDSKKATLGKALIAAYKNFVPAANMQLIAGALSAFWLLPSPVVFTGAPPGAVITAVPLTLSAALSAILATNQAIASGGGEITGPKSASQWAKALHTWTTTSVIAAHAGPTPCTSPLI